jgi:two-component system phosphate regulon response regulator PhoB
VPQPVARKTVLIVEDDRALRELYRTVLRQAGYEVGAVEDGTDALHRLEHWTPDVVVLDLALPRLDGRDLRHELRSRPDTRDIPVIIVTGTDTSDLDPDDFAAILRKPIDADILVDAVNAAVRAIRRATTEPT